jgi:hypothetical protein
VALVALTARLLIASGATTEPSATLLDAAGQGTKFTSAEVDRIESDLRYVRNNATEHAQLLGYYSLRPGEQTLRRREHVLWMVQNRPADPIAATGYCRIDPELDRDGEAQLRALWLHQQAKDPDNPAILLNAATALIDRDEVDAELFLQHGAELEPKNAKWPQRLAELYELRAARSHDSRENRERAASLALAQRQKACYLTLDVTERFHIFIEMPRDAVRAGDFLQAKRLGLQLLDMASLFQKDPEYGTAIHVGNIALGRVALHTGDVDTANGYLTAAGQAQASPTLTGAGPDMSLAAELLARGQRRTVRDYLAACAKTWKSGSARVHAWIDTVDAGGTPDFGGQSWE